MIDGLLHALTPRVLGALVRRHRDLSACEDALQEALFAAATTWPRIGTPADPGAWLIHVANRKLTDVYRAESSRRSREEAAGEWETHAPAVDEAIEASRDDSLDLLFLCCQPTLSRTSAVALTLRAFGGLSTAEIARAFMVPEATMAQRLSRARQTVNTEGLFAEPLAPAERHARLPSVMQVLYLIFSEGYAASSGDVVHRVDLAREAIRLTRMLGQLVPNEPEVEGLLALMLLTDGRRAARTGPSGELVPLDEQDRSKWDRTQIAEGSALIEAVFSRGAVGPYQLQAAIAALHDEAESADATDWRQIAALYEVLHRMTASPIVALNLAVAVAMIDGPRAGLTRLDALANEPLLEGSYRLSAARAHLLERAGDVAAARVLFLEASNRTDNIAERDYLLLKAAKLAR